MHQVGLKIPVSTSAQRRSLKKKVFFVYQVFFYVAIQTDYKTIKCIPSVEFTTAIHTQVLLYTDNISSDALQTWGCNYKKKTQLP